MSFYDYLIGGFKIKKIKQKLGELYSHLVWLWRMRDIVTVPGDAVKIVDPKTAPNFEARFRFKGGYFVCRRQDWFGVEEVFLNGEYLPALSVLKGLTSPVIVDLGANIGAFALYAFGYYPDARIISVEAAPDTFNYLDSNRALNNEYSWKVVNAAVWNEESYVILERRKESTGNRVSSSESDGETIPAKRMETILSEENIEHIDLMKIDIEGAEHEVIPGSVSVLKKVRALLIEVHTDRLNPDKIYSTLSACFSHAWVLTGRNALKPVYIFSHENMNIPNSIKIDINNI